jgi:ABC-type multidrug transport system ATPase subunit
MRYLRSAFEFADCIGAVKSLGATHVAVDNMSLVVQPGQCFGLLGSNGAGKSTLINVLTGLLPATDGVARVAGFDIATQVRNVHLSIGVCPQHELLWPTLTVMEHLAFYARVKGVDCREERRSLRALVSAVGLAHVRNDRAANLSGGMKRRLSIAIALAGDSKVLVLDEPSTGLDPASRRQTWNVIDAAKVCVCMCVCVCVLSLSLSVCALATYACYFSRSLPDSFCRGLVEQWC